MTSQSIAVFARHPSPGKVKTRLAAKVGDTAACRFYKNCAEHVLQELQRCEDTQVHLFVSDIDELSSVDQWMQDNGLAMQIVGQLQSDNLGDRIFHALKHLKLTGYSKVAVVATDIPDITHSVIHQGLALLDTYDVVLGPAVDGGFYFLAVNDMTRELFDDVEWSTSTVLEKTVSNARRLQLRVAPLHSLPPIADIDTFEDLCLWVQFPTESDSETVVNASLEKLARSENP